GDIGGSFVGGTGFVLRPARDIAPRNLLKHVREQLHANRSEFNIELARWTAARKRQRGLGGDGARIDAFVDPVDAHPGLAVVIPIGPENRIDSAMTRQRRGMHVERANASRSESCGRNDPWK